MTQTNSSFRRQLTDVGLLLKGYTPRLEKPRFLVTSFFVVFYVLRVLLYNEDQTQNYDPVKPSYTPFSRYIGFL